MFVLSPRAVSIRYMPSLFTGSQEEECVFCCIYGDIQNTVVTGLPVKRMSMRLGIAIAENLASTFLMNL